MNLKALRVFLEVIRAGSLSAAARNLELSQPAVTKQIQALEEELGARLLVRGHQGVVGLTPAGEFLSDYARDVLSGYERLRLSLRALSSQDGGELYIAASTTPGHFILPALLLEFRTRHPAIRTHLHIANTSTVRERVREGLADLGIIGGQVHDADLVALPFAKDRIVLAVPADHPFAARGEVVLSELFDQKLILREPGSGTRESIERSLSSGDRRALNDAAVLVLGSTHAILIAIAQGAGIGFVSERAIDSRTSGDIVAVPVQGHTWDRELVMIYRRDREQLAPLELFARFAVERDIVVSPGLAR